MFIEWLLQYRETLIVKYTKNKVGKLQDNEVPCECITAATFTKTNFSPDFYLKIIFYEFSPLNFQKIITKGKIMYHIINIV